MKVEHEEELQSFAKCLREHGVAVQASPAGGLVFDAKPRGAGPESPAFKEAQSLCAKQVPGIAPGGGHKTDLGIGG